MLERFAILVALSFSSIVAQGSGAAEGLRFENGALLNGALEGGLGHESNISLSDEDQISSWFWQVSPEFELLLSPSNFTHVFKGSSQIRQYMNSHEDDFEDLKIIYTGRWEPNSQHRSRAVISIVKGHQKRGDGFTQDLSQPLEEVIQTDDKTLTLAHEYGRLVAKGRIGGELSYADRDFSNLHDFTDQFAFEQYGAGGWFYYRVGQQTNLTVDVAYDTYDYKLDEDVPRDSDSVKLLLGAVWEGLSKTTGQFKLGVERKMFGSAARNDYTGLTFDVGATWKPKTYSEFALDMNRAISEARLTGDPIVKTMMTVNWMHTWSEYMSSGARYQLRIDDEQGTRNRRDERHLIGVNVSRSLAKSVLVTGEIAWVSNHSNLPGFDYTNALVSIGLRVNL
ncbi:hypothetical protein DXV75_03960 [Alteromonas aestuariivivens]|uniref:Beta-barrel porin 2 n=1 Tax=Alteromonas aestuariivivens TaxID=1938339 RepID=A0A3D8MCA4_9ALTE|nr:outer membrane beta-barrel protein [Alteromonas aestuariivivens]RDV28126.1 hypothetical protein DXV75_03960 [Alteromonas aestuariivivens]